MENNNTTMNMNTLIPITSIANPFHIRELKAVIASLQSSREFANSARLSRHPEQEERFLRANVDGCIVPISPAVRTDDLAHTVTTLDSLYHAASRRYLEESFKPQLATIRESGNDVDGNVLEVSVSMGSLVPDEEVPNLTEGQINDLAVSIWQHFGLCPDAIRAAGPGEFFQRGISYEIVLRRLGEYVLRITQHSGRDI